MCMCGALCRLRGAVAVRRKRRLPAGQPASCLPAYLPACSAQPPSQTHPLAPCSLWEDVEQPQPHGSPAGGCSPCAQQQHAQQQLGAAGADGGAAAAATAAPEQRASCFIEWAEAGEGYQLPERRQQPWWRRKAEGPGASCGKVGI